MTAKPDPNHWRIIAEKEFGWLRIYGGNTYLQKACEEIERLRRPHPEPRILELELEVKRLRSALEKTKERYWERAYDGSGNVKALSVNEFSIEVNDALSTPPPALAEAYVRLRDAAHTVTHYESSNKMAAELAEIERLEKGE